VPVASMNYFTSGYGTTASALTVRRRAGECVREGLFQVLSPFEDQCETDLLEPAALLSGLAPH